MGRKVTVPDLRAMKAEGRRIAMMTAYDTPTARLLDRAGIDAILVGDSLGNVVLGFENTLAVTMEHMLHHTAAVRRGVSRALLIADLPFMSYQVSVEQGMINAGRLIQEGGADAVKLEGGEHVAPLVRRLTQAGIPVMGHIGLTPQSVHQMGGFRIQGRDEASARAITEGARALEEAGAFAIVLEGMPASLAAQVTASVGIPTIGIGSGPHCDGQVLVFHDAVGLYDEFTPRFVKRFAELGKAAEAAVAAYIDEVRRGTFPGPEHSFK